MPVVVRKRGKRWRLVNKRTGRIEKTPSGQPRDGGGHGSKEKAAAQARAINSS